MLFFKKFSINDFMEITWKFGVNLRRTVIMARFIIFWWFSIYLNPLTFLEKCPHCLDPIHTSSDLALEILSFLTWLMTSPLPLYFLMKHGLCVERLSLQTTWATLLNYYSQRFYGLEFSFMPSSNINIWVL